MIPKLVFALCMVIAFAAAVPNAKAGPLCRVFGGCGAVQADYSVQKGPRRERAWRLFQRGRR